nr:MAG TPA: hypothetical protein [Caudoviricetes sp.]
MFPASIPSIHRARNTPTLTRWTCYNQVGFW